MNFYEKQTEEGYTYNVEDAFGTIEIRSPEKLEASNLDEVFMAIFQTHQDDKGTIESVIQGTEIYYTFNKKNPWQSALDKSKISEKK